MTDATFLRRAYDNGLDCVGVVDDDYVVQYWNPQLEELSEISTTKAVGSRLHDLLPRLRDSEHDRLLKVAVRGDGVVGAPPFFAAADRTRAFQYEWFAAPLSSRGRLAGAAFVARDVAARGNLEYQMTEAEQRFRSMADGSPVLLWMAGCDGLCDFFNATWLEFSGRTLAEELGFGWAEGVHPEDVERCMSTYMAAFSARRPFEMDYRLRRHDGTYRWLLDRGTPRFTPGGDFAGFIGSCVDITDRIEAETATKKLATELERSNRYMEQLLYATSHDLREPMRMVAMYVELLSTELADRLEPAERKHMGFALEGADRMRTMVDDLLNFARLRSSEPTFEPVSLEELFQGLVQELAQNIEQKRAQVSVATLPSVRGDATLLHSLFSNLLRNALKFHGDDPPQVEVTAVSEGDEVVVCVADRGIGFPPEFAERAFELFERLHTRKRFPGTGIGLALARDIAQRHGGRIWAKAAPDQGAKFFVSLPGGS